MKQILEVYLFGQVLGTHSFLLKGGFLHIPFHFSGYIRNMKNTLFFKLKAVRLFGIIRL